MEAIVLKKEKVVESCGLHRHEADTRTSRSASPSLRNDGSASEAPEQGAQVNLRWAWSPCKKEFSVVLDFAALFKLSYFYWFILSISFSLHIYIYIYVCVCPACQLRLFLLRVL